MAVDPQTGGVQAISCASPLSCDAVDTSGGVVSWNGSTWTAPTKIANSKLGTFASLHCTTPTSCIATTSNGAVDVTTTAGWSGLQTVDPTLQTASCPSTTLCLGTDAKGLVLLTSNGTSWNHPRLLLAGNPSAMSASCTSPSFCLALVGTVNGYVAYQFDGTSLAGPFAAWPNEDSLLLSLWCASPTLCLALVQPDSAPQMMMVYNGSTWSYDTPPVGSDENGQPVVQAISCAPSNHCVLLEFDGTVLAFNGTTWSSLATYPSSALASQGGVADMSLSCPTTLFCMAIAATSDGPAYAMTLRSGVWSPPTSVDPLGGGLAELTCPTTASCFAASPRGDALTYSGTHWSTSNLPKIPGTSKLSPWIASCPQPDFCVVPTASSRGGGLSTFNGHTWSPPALESPSAAWDPSCGAADSCVAITESSLPAYDRTAFFSTYTDGHWSKRHPMAIGYNEQWGSGLSCVGSHFCMRVGAAETGTYETPTGVYSIYNGTSWSAEAPIRGLVANETSVSCGNPTLCVAYDTGGSPDVAIFNGRTWSKVRSLGRTVLPVSASCAGPSFCMVIDATGQAFTYWNRTWSAPQTTDQVDGTSVTMVAVTCTSAWYCLAADSAGYTVRLHR
jgi:hypothetical protein